MRIFFSLSCISTLLFFLYYTQRVDSISHILTSPDTYDGSEVTVTGSVEHAFGLLGNGGYVISDGTSKLYVLTSKGVPSTGTKVEVKGTFRKAITINQYEYNALIEESHK